MGVNTDYQIGPAWQVKAAGAQSQLAVVIRIRTRRIEIKAAKPGRHLWQIAGLDPAGRVYEQVIHWTVRIFADAPVDQRGERAHSSVPEAVGQFGDVAVDLGIERGRHV